MSALRHFAGICAVCLVMLATVGVFAQEFPARPIRIVTSAVGGSNDLASRLLAPMLSSPLGQPVVVDNRPGVVAIEMLLRAAPDGHTLLLYGNVTWLDPLMRDKPL